MPRILVVDDDPHIREVIRFALEKAGFAVVLAEDGGRALAVFARHSVDLIVLDIGMPEMDGLEVCRRIRRTSEVPILFLSARDEEIDRVLGLEIGGDDYVTKPFSPRELAARINVILKRTRAAPQVEDRMLARGDLTLDLAGHRAVFGVNPIVFTVLEFAILKTLASRPNQVFSRDQILDAAYAGAVHVSDRTIDSHIRNIRAKLAQAGCGQAIETVHGVGFRLGACEAAP
jgi:two-component system OmpR family response regulator